MAAIVDKRDIDARSSEFKDTVDGIANAASTSGRDDGVNSNRADSRIIRSTA